MLSIFFPIMQLHMLYGYRYEKGKMGRNARKQEIRDGWRFLLSMAVPHSCLGSQPRPLAPSVASVRSVSNDMVDNEMILGAVHRSPVICLTAEENPRKPLLGNSDREAMRPVIASNGVVSSK